MRTRTWLAGAGACVLLVGGVVWVQTRPGDDGDWVVVSPDAQPLLGGLAQPLADVGEVLEGRRPELFVDLPWVLAASGTDYEVGHRSTLLAVSDDGGESFRAIEFDEPVAAPKAVVHGDTAVLVGLHCAPPVDAGDAVCETAAADQVAFRLDLATGSVEAVTPAPIEGTIVSAIGASGDAAVFFAHTAEGEQIVTRHGDGSWSTAPAPAGADSVCAVDDTLVAVVPAAPFSASPAPTEPGSQTGPPQTAPGGSEMPEVGQGEVLWQATTSRDGGDSWGDPVPFRSQVERDFGFVLGVTCGPRYVMVNTAQLAAFDPAAERWQAIELPAEGASQLAPGGAASWASSNEFVIWTVTEALAPPPTGGGPDEPVESPPRGTRAVEVTGIGSPDVAVGVGPVIDTATGQPANLLSPSAEASGFVVEIGENVALGRIR